MEISGNAPNLELSIAIYCILIPNWIQLSHTVNIYRNSISPYNIREAQYIMYILL